MTQLNFDEKSSERTFSNIEQTEINTDELLLKREPNSFENILKKCGDLGRFQIFHYFLTNSIAMICGVVGFFYVFGAADPKHRCRLPVSVWPNDDQYYSINSTHQILIDTFIPKTSDGKDLENCLRRDTSDPNAKIVSCPNGWVYDRSVFGLTFTEQANLVCDNEMKKSWLATCFQLGGLSVIIIGSMADRYGRKRMTVILMIVVLLTSVITQIFIQFISMSIDVKFSLLALNQFASGLTAAAFSLTFILLLELTSSSHMSFSGNFSLVAFTIGEMIVTGFAYLTFDWQKLKWACTGFVGLVTLYLYWMPESPLFFLSKRDYTKLERILRRISEFNRKKEEDWFPDYQEFVRIHQTSESKTEQSFFKQLAKTFRVASLRMRLFVSALSGFTTLMLYIKISYGLTSMDISPYLGFLIGAGVEAVGYVIGSSLINTRLARKGSFILMMSLTTICVTLIPILTDRSPLTTVFIAQFGKFAISGAIAVSWIFVPELFPTSIRSSANGFFIALSRAGAIVAPIIDTSISKKYLPYTFYASSVLSVLVIFLTFFLPETKNKSLGDDE